MLDHMLERLRRELTVDSERFAGVAGFCARDLVTGSEISLLGDEPFPSASTIKIYILVTLLCQAEQESSLLQQRISIDTRVPGSGILTYLENAVELSLLDLAILMMIVSDNTATNMCIDRAGIDNINATIAGFGLKNTALRRAMQDAEAIAAGRENISTPHDLVATFAALHAGKPTPAVARRALDIMSKPFSTPFRAAVPDSVRMAHKPGGMPRVRSEASLVFLPKRPYAFSVMCKYAMGDNVEQAAFLSEMARKTHRVFATLDDTNAFGQGLSAS
ncbi:MAG: serine hydrolase [Chloroflexi bacterium]|nr:serine hydrolase [Chloroflexota bacterium]